MYLYRYFNIDVHSTFNFNSPKLKIAHTDINKRVYTGDICIQRISFSNKNKWTITLNHMDEFQNNLAQWKKPGTSECIIYNHILQHSKKWKLLQWQKGVCSCLKKGEIRKGWGIAESYGNPKVYYLVCGNTFIGMYIYKTLSFWTHFTNAVYFMLVLSQ